MNVNDINRVQQCMGLNMFVFNDGSVVHAPDIAVSLYEELKRMSTPQPPTERYMIFACETYYPEGGIHDLKHNSNSLDECYQIMINHEFGCGSGKYHIYDTVERKIIKDVFYSIG